MAGVVLHSAAQADDCSRPPAGRCSIVSVFEVLPGVCQALSSDGRHVAALTLVSKSYQGHYVPAVPQQACVAGMCCSGS